MKPIMIGIQSDLQLNYRFNQFVCFEFLKTGSEKLQIAHDVANQNAFSLVAGGAVGAACYGQGFELLCKASFSGLDLKEPGGHKIAEMYQTMCQQKLLQDNLSKLTLPNSDNSFADEAANQVAAIDKGWMKARYLALNSKNLELPNPFIVNYACLAIIATFFPNLAAAFVEHMGMPDKFEFKVLSKPNL